MSMNYLEQLELEVLNGVVYFACECSANNEWFISEDLTRCRERAQRTANQRRLDIVVYRLVPRSDASPGDVYLAVRRILEPNAKGEPNIRWVIVDTKDAAELCRDVSLGTSPYFGAVVEDVLSPVQEDGSRGRGTGQIRR